MNLRLTHIPCLCIPGYLFLCLIISCSSGSQNSLPHTSVQSKPEIMPVNQSAIPVGKGLKAIIHPTIIFGDGSTSLEDGCILVSEGLIHSVAKFSEISIPEGAEVIDATGMSLLPGLIDAHFHLDKLDSLPSIFLSKGITSLRDPGAWIEAYDGERARNIPLPRLYLTGPHIDMFPPAYPDNSFVVRDPLEAQSAVHQFADQGASAIKIYFRCSPSIIQAICEAAQTRHIPVTAHLEITDIYEAVRSGLSGIEHITSLGTNLVSSQMAESYKQALLKDNNARRSGRYKLWASINPEGKPASDLALFLANQQTFICPTLGAFEYQISAKKSDSTRLTGFQHMMSYTQKLHKAGVNIAVGSHSWVPYSAYGWAYHHELELLEKAGITPLEIIHSATLLNAQFLGIAEKLGSIAPGKIADLVLVKGDPRAGIRALREIEGVMLGGEWIER